jgi:hypothetical protein
MYVYLSAVGWLWHVLTRGVVAFIETGIERTQILRSCAEGRNLRRSQRDAVCSKIFFHVCYIHASGVAWDALRPFPSDYNLSRRRTMCRRNLLHNRVLQDSGGWHLWRWEGVPVGYTQWGVRNGHNIVCSVKRDRVGLRR